MLLLVVDSLGFFLRLREEDRGVKDSRFFRRLLMETTPSRELLPVSSAPLRLLNLRLPSVFYRCLIRFLSSSSAI